ncbi:DNA polymerase I [compost metagenome]
MLYGSLTYNDEELGKINYDLYARDTFEDLKLYIINNFNNFKNYQRAAEVFDRVVTPEGVTTFPYEGQDTADERRLDIKRTNKYKSNIPNRDFCMRISAMVRYMLINGKTNYNQFSMGGDEFSPTRIVTIEEFGHIKYHYGLITELIINAPYFSLELREIKGNNYDEGIFKELKQKDKYNNILSVTKVENIGFKLCDELLGFEFKPTVSKELLNLTSAMYETIEDVIDAHPDKNTSWILNRNYIIVNDDNLEEIWNKIMSHNGYVAFDTETSGLKINFKSRTGEADQLVGVVLAIERGTGYYFPLQHKTFTNLCKGEHWYFMEKYMKPILEGKKIICHNVKFDWKVAYIYDIVVNCVYDTMIALGVTKRYEEENYELGLKSLVKNIFGLDMFDLDDFIPGGSFTDSGIAFWDLPYEIVRRYAPADADMTLSLFEFIEKEHILAKYEAYDVFDLEVVFAMAVAYSEFYGYHLNIEKVPELTDRIVGGMNKYKSEMFALAKREFNPNSPKQLSAIMYDEMGMETRGTKRSTDKETLKTLMEYRTEDGGYRYPFVKALKNYRDSEGIFKNFLKRLPEFSSTDGFIHPDVLQLGTNTGRCSIKNPNYQSYNDTVKKYVCPRPDFITFDSDFGQIEYRVLASMAEQESLIEAFNDPDLDYHTYQASRMFGIPYSAVTKALRQQSKGVNFGLPYGMGDSSLGVRIYGERNDTTRMKAAELRKKFFKGQEKIQDFFEDVRSEGVANGFTKTKFGRRRYYHRSKFSVAQIRRQAGNHVIQGTAADVYKIAVNNMFKRIIAEGWLGKVLLNAFVHDELLMEVHKSINLYYFFKAWREEFEVEIDGFCKLYAGAGVGWCWYDAKKQDLPPQYVQEIIDTYQEDMVWDEDLDKFVKNVIEGYEEYKNRRVTEFITAEENKGQVVTPVIYSLLVELSNNMLKDLRANPDTDLYKSVDEEVKGLVSSGKDAKSLQDCIAVYALNKGLDLVSIDIRNPDEAVANSDEEVEDNEFSISFDDDTYSIDDLIRMRGYYLDDTKDILYVTNRPMVYKGININTINYFIKVLNLFKLEGKYQICLFDETTGEYRLYKAFISPSDYEMVIKIYNSLNPSVLFSGFL